MIFRVFNNNLAIPLKLNKEDENMFWAKEKNNPIYIKPSIIETIKDFRYDIYYYKVTEYHVKVHNERTLEICQSREV